jgi:hypothetical protein
MAATQKQIDSLAKARAARKFNKENVVSTLTETYDTPQIKFPLNQLKQPLIPADEIWLDALLVVIRNREVKTVPEVKQCIAVADEVLRLHREKFQ